MSAASFPRLVRLRWDLGKDDFKRVTTELIAEYKRVLDKIAGLDSSQLSFERVFRPFAELEAEAMVTSSSVTFPSHVSSDSSIREASSEAKEELSRAEIEAMMRQDVYLQMKKAVEEEATSEGAHGLQGEHQRYAQLVLREYRRNGMALSADIRSQNEALSKQISDLCIRFEKNIGEDSSGEWLTASELEGLPVDLLKSLEQSPDTGKYRLTMKYPHILPALAHVRDASVRSRLDRTFKSRQQEANVSIAEQVLALRHQQATLLGYPTWNHYALEVCMAKNPETVQKFYQQLLPKLQEKGRLELAALSQLKIRLESERLTKAESATAMEAAPIDGTIYSYDFSYYHTRMQESMGVDHEVIRQYFPMEHVIKEMLGLYEKLFCCRFVKQEPSEELPVWHADVQVFLVYDCSEEADSSQPLGCFYMDLHPRDGKFSHAAVFPLQHKALGSQGQLIAPVAALVCNFTKPTADKPSLLKHQEVVTLLHEFGHQVHCLFTRAQYQRTSGTSVERDFVECPSQMLEEWCYVPQVIRRLSKHYETGEPLPHELIKSLVELKNLNSGLQNLRQMFLGQIDQKLHSGPVEKGTTQGLWHQLRHEIALIPEAEGANPLANFGHLFGGYDSRYYGYLWSNVYAAALFDRFAQAGFDDLGNCLDPALGLRYRQEILAPGGSRDSDESLRLFLGADPTVEPFLRSIGLQE